MPCRVLRDPKTGQSVGIACGPGPAKTCRFCRSELKRNRKSTKLCDWKTTANSTCDAPMCDEHATSVGPEKDLCPPHNARLEEIKDGRERLARHDWERELDNKERETEGENP